MKQDAAVSSVVGVMLMLTITVVLFGVVALVATPISRSARICFKLSPTVQKDAHIPYPISTGNPSL